MSDEEEDFDGSGSSEGGDFSDYSEDDWKPDGESEEESDGGTQESPSSSSPDKQTRFEFYSLHFHPVVKLTVIYLYPPDPLLRRQHRRPIADQPRRSPRPPQGR